jgi:hypothetical protein
MEEYSAHSTFTGATITRAFRIQPPGFKGKTQLKKAAFSCLSSENLIPFQGCFSTDLNFIVQGFFPQALVKETGVDS